MYGAKIKRQSYIDGIIFEMPAEVEALAEQHMGEFGGIMTIKEYPELYALAPTQTYEGRNWVGHRCRIDQLDQVTFSRIK